MAKPRLDMTNNVSVFFDRLFPSPSKHVWDTACPQGRGDSRKTVIILCALADELQIQLQKLGVELNDRHPVLGKPTEQLQTLVQKK